MSISSQDINSIDQIDYLIERTAPHLRALELSIFAKRSRNRLFSGEEAAHYEELLKPIRQRRLELTNDLIKNPEKFHLLLKEEKAKEQEEIRLKHEKEEQERFYNQPWAAAYLNHWCKASYWTLDEAISLSFGKDPKYVDWTKVQPLLPYNMFARKYEQLRDLVLRARNWKQLTDPVSPGFYIAWVRKNNIDFPAQLEKMVRDRGEIIENWETAYESLKKEYAEYVQKSEQIIRNQEQQINDLSSEKDSLKATVEKNQYPGERAETTYLNIIGSLLYILLGEDLKGKKYSSFKTQDSIIEMMLTCHPDKQGIKKRTLEEKFAEAKRSLEDK